MNYIPKEIISFIEENDVKFIRLTFTDLYGNLKNIAIMPCELKRAFEYGIPFEAGFFSKHCSDLLLFPDISTMSVLPWRPKSGRVIRFFCNIKHIDGTPYEGDMRSRLCSFIDKMRDKGYSCKISTRCEFYLLDTDENGNPTKIPHDNASYLDIAPLDKCENTRREICLSLEEMGFNPQTSRHSYGPGQNEIDFKHSNPVSAADNMVYYKTVVKNVASQNGLFASFMPKPVHNQSGSGLHIGISIKKDGKHIFSSDTDSFTDTGRSFTAGILNRINEITCFLNPTTNSYRRLNENLSENKNGKQSDLFRLVRVPYSYGNDPCIELCSADASCNPYIAFMLILMAGLEGIEADERLDKNLSEGGRIFRSDRLPTSLEDAVSSALSSKFIKDAFGENVHEDIFRHFKSIISDYNASDDKTKFEDEIWFRNI
ncbi:MAG: glutamine synthetase [Ruminococcus sp.]|nr:glutamine synthetase [Ruminococcus sp.]